MIKGLISKYRLAERSGQAIIFAMAFAVLGYYVPNLYYKYLDSTQYLKITEPVSVDQSVYKPCDGVVLNTQLEALVDINVKSLTQLILIKEGDGTEKTNVILRGELPIKAMGPHIVSGQLPLPCDLKEARYFWQGNLTYSIRGIEKTISFITESFDVTKTGNLTQDSQVTKETIVRQPIFITPTTVTPTPVPGPAPKPRGKR